MRQSVPIARGNTAKPSQARGRRFIDWSKVDWRLQAVAIAERLGVSQSTVCSKRKQLGAPRPLNWHKHRNRKQRIAKWQAWDWSKQDVELAAEKGLSRERIRQIRQLVGARPSPRRGQHRPPRQALQWAKDHLHKLRGLTERQVLEQYGLKLPRLSLVRGFLKEQHALRDARCRHPWEQMNFDLPNCDLARIWRIPCNQAGRYRERNHLPRPKWRLAGRLRRVRPEGQLRAYQQAEKAEANKARRYFASAAVRRAG